MNTRSMSLGQFATIGSVCGLTALEIGRARARTNRDYLHDRDLAMVAEYNSGFGAFAVGRHFDLPVNHVADLLDGRVDIAPNRRWRRTPGPRETAVILTLWNRFRSTQHITQLIGLREQHVTRALTDSDVNPRTPEPPDQPPDGFLAGFTAGIGSFYQLCACFGIPAWWGKQWLRTAQLARPERFQSDLYHRKDVRASLMDAGIEPPGYRHIVTTELAPSILLQ